MRPVVRGRGSMTRQYRPVPQPEPDPGETWGPIAGP